MTRHRSSIEPKLYPFRVLTKSLKAEAFTLQGSTVIPQGEHILTEGIRLEVIYVQGRITAVGLMDEKRTSRTQEFTMFRVSSFKLFEKSSAL